MAFVSNHIPTLLGVYDNELAVYLFPSNNNGKILGRDSLENMHHAGGSPELHPTLPNVIKNTNGHVFLAGSFQFEWRWDPADVSEEDVDNYITLLQSQAPAEATITKDVATNTIIMTLSDSNYHVPQWTGRLIEWHPKAPSAKIINTSDDSEFICVTRLNGTYHEYNFDQISVEPNESLEIVRPTCEKCFVMFSGDVTAGQKNLTKHKMYKLTSSSIEITNNGDQRIRVLRYTKGAA
jgi:hypothetical protein